MGLDFLLQHGGRRLRHYLEQPPLDTSADEQANEGEKIALDFELPPERWQARSVSADTVEQADMPQRFIDGCHYGKTVACLADALRHPIPVRLAEIGGICLQREGRWLRRQFVQIERIVCFIADPFPGPEVESFAQALATIDMRLVPALPPLIEETRQLTYDYASMEQRTYTQAQVSMRVLEERALAQDCDTLSLVDGPLGRLDHPRVIGVVKQHRKNYLGTQPHCWQVYYDLEPGQRTPAFRLASQSHPLLSWFLKLDGAHGAMPNWGIIRIEIRCAHFESQGSDFGYVDRLSNALLHLRSRKSSYARTPVSLEPIVRAEESLKALLTPPSILAQRFYRLTGL